MNPKAFDGSSSAFDSVDEMDAELAELFARAQSYRPPTEQLTTMLRGVPGPSALTARRVLRVGGPFMATAAAVACVALLVLSSHTQPAFALSRVADAMRTVAVVQQTLSDGSVYWESPGRCSAVRPPDGGEYVFRDYVRETIATYQPARGCIVMSTGDTPELSHGLRGECTLADLIQTAESWGRSFAERWQRTDRTENGRPVIVLVSKLPETWLRSATIDGVSGRFVRTETRAGTTAYAYPDDAPRDLRDVGVPRDVPVIDGTAPPQVLALRDQVRVRARRGLGAYRLVSVDRSETMRVISDGYRWRVDILREPEERPGGLSELETRARSYDHMESLVRQVYTTEILAGDVETVVHFDEQGAVAQRRVRPQAFGLAKSHTLETQIDWSCSPEAFFGTWGNEQCAALGPDEHGWIGYGIRGQANRVARPYYRERWYDPTRGYVLCYTWSYDDPQAEWQLTPDWRKEYAAYTLGPYKPSADAPAAGSFWEVVQWAELRPGQWYPAVSRSGDLERAADGSWRHATTDQSGSDTARYQVLRATALGSVDEQWFEIPAEWLRVPAQPAP